MFNPFRKPPRLLCGGEGTCEVLANGKVCGTISYREPTSNEKLDYAYQFQSILNTESQLKEISDSENKRKKIHEILVKNVGIPFSKKIFLRSTGFLDDKGKPIDSLPADEQFNFIEQYFGFALIELTTIAFETNNAIKKKF